MATIIGHSHKDLVEVTVDVDGEAGDAVSTLIATVEHPFWVDDHGRLLQPAAHGLWGERPGWYEAADLDPGDQLRTPTGDHARIVDVRAYTTTTTVHNLTINGIHTYYVGADGKSVLTHNADEGLTADQQKKIRSYEQLIQEHEKKLADYLADPDAYDNKGILENAPSEEVRQRIINGRENQLEKEMATFRGDIEKVKGAAREGTEMEIDLERLRVAIDVLIGNTVRNVGPVVTVDVDEFWTVPNDDAFELGGEPQLTIGSVSESWAQAQKVTSDGDATVGYGYVWIADILRALGYKYVG